ncbi:MAG: tripartite tricarboxylate transporter substrate-binding protein [Spirochaetota bacterium]
MAKRVAHPAMVIAIMTICAGCADTGADLAFFKDKTITIIVPHGPGGMDLYARAIAPYLQKYLPGSRLEVKNVPEGGGIAGRNEVYAAKPDGLTLGFTTTAGALLAEWAGQPDVRYSTARFSYIGRVNAEAHVMVASPRTGFRTLADIVRAKKVVMGFAGVSSDDYYVALITARLLGFEVDARTRFLGINDASLACVRGEVDAILFSASSVMPQITAKTVVPIVSYGDVAPSDQSGLPTIFESIPAGKKPLIQTLVHMYALERTLFAPPSLSEGRLKTLRDALDKAVADPEFRSGMKAVQRPVNYLGGSETTALLMDILAYEAEIKPLVRLIATGSS